MKRFLIFPALFLVLCTQANASPSETPSDDESIVEPLDVSDNIRSLLKSESGLSSGAKNVGIYQKHNCIILRGSVKSLEEKNKVEQIAVEASPGIKIINDMKIR
jgi:osmotically-inducible protein OsmY